MKGEIIMTISGWFLFVFFASIIGILGIAAAISFCESAPGKVAAIILTIILIVALLFGMRWYFNNTASGQRALIDQKSEFANGFDRTVTVYTASGDVIATYTGKIDIDTNDGGYIKFDFEGKRYIYYNCFVETIAEIE
jgi:uncharacterized membrane protein